MTYDASHHIGACVGLYFVSAILGFTLVFAIRPTASANWFRTLMENGNVLTSMTKSRDNAIQRMTPGTVQIQGVIGAVLCAIIGINIGSLAVETARDGALAFIGAIVIFAAGLCLAFGVAFSLSLGTAVAGAIATTVWVPGVEATVGGGQWAGVPALDGDAAVDVVRSLIE